MFSSWFQRRRWARAHIFVNASVVVERGVRITCHNGGRVDVSASSVLKEQVKIGCNGGHVRVGERVQISYFAVIASHGNITIGDDTLIAERVSIRGSQHHYHQGATSKLEQGYTIESVVIGRNVWIGANCVILPGVHIGDHSVIGAGAVVTHSIPAGKVAVGVPAKVVGDVPGL